MIDGLQRWENVGLLLRPDRRIPWMAARTAAAFALRVGASDRYDIYVTGVDAKKRSSIGRFRIDLRDPVASATTPRQVFTWGERGAFDENGVAYPCVVRRGRDLWMYYVGWMPTVLTPFQNHTGLARSTGGGAFRRVSRAPILDRTDREPFCTGSCNVLRDGGRWRMWYTSFLRWGRDRSDAKHYYIIRQATSSDGISWGRGFPEAVGIEHAGEYAIARPSVLKEGGLYHMWYCFRGRFNRIGYARSRDGVRWTRRDKDVVLPPASRWDAESQSYPHVFRHGADLYMLYCGNDYGGGGLGLARLTVGR